MPNHVHIIAVPATEQSLSKAFGRAHQGYSRAINSRFEWSGHLWEQRYHSVPMDEAHLLMAARYVELNPVRARLVAKPDSYRWSSARAHLFGDEDGILEAKPLLALVDNWAAFLEDALSDEQTENFRQLEKSGYPAGNEVFIANLEKQFGVQCRPKTRGPKPKQPRLPYLSTVEK